MKKGKSNVTNKKIKFSSLDTARQLEIKQDIISKAYKAVESDPCANAAYRKNDGDIFAVAEKIVAETISKAYPDIELADTDPTGTFGKLVKITVENYELNRANRQTRKENAGMRKYSIEMTQEYLDYETKMRRLICQYCLDQGVGIYWAGENVPEGTTVKSMMTTNDEVEKAASENRKVRYVDTAQIDFFMAFPRPWQLREAISRNYDICDWDEWQLLQSILGIELSSATAGEINTVLWADCDLSVRDLDYQNGAPDALERLLFEDVDEDARAKIIDILNDAGIDAEKLIASRKREPAQNKIVTVLPEIPDGFPAKSVC